MKQPKYWQLVYRMEAGHDEFTKCSSVQNKFAVVTKLLFLFQRCELIMDLCFLEILLQICTSLGTVPLKS